jgi:hypothetical protein
MDNVYTVVPFILDLLIKAKILETSDIIKTYNFPCSNIAKNEKNLYILLLVGVLAIQDFGNLLLSSECMQISSLRRQ